MDWKLKSFEELSKEELYQIVKLRIDVFIVEQDCPYHELDDMDQKAHHLYLAEGSAILAYCRLFRSGEVYDEASIGRVIVRSRDRGKGHAKALLDKALSFLENEWKEKAVKIKGQDYLRSFYGSFGFKEVSEVYLEDGIPHVDMVKSFSGASRQQ
ncbi:MULTISPECIES: GNAT family N-acetyltransferase [Bacillus]|uniref:GNAT family N-acetyltransferase n=1 Tax=Bacillus glycinifermentans TaxID=1664069 RepID=A0AAJ4D300_9BACI|nr:MULTISPECIES: GNAT family N-acetyltransferase [Bacillus]KKB74672.1 GNAT family acetyltransferase [Bacillus sp. TH008]MDU0070977.1 GNAT family N-acetyltransferase [Bacillus sp. IG6]MED8018844.1 GNAT family N-acetyltransferase [Bacillus glycinifermentans]QAT65909.1 GNAT family N-acetyltransferase [Bacillus glycinifermentans]WKB75611.1 GNAT family N-acetyltransferase [Bacillus glycinifermentans]